MNKVVENFSYLGNGFYLARTQAGFRQAFYHYCAGADKLELRGHPESYPAVVTFAQQYEGYFYYVAMCIHVNSLSTKIAESDKLFKNATDSIKENPDAAEVEKPVKAQPVKLVYGLGFEKCSVQECTHVTLYFPGPVGQISIPVITSGTRKDTGCWSWNGDIYKPTLKPSFHSTVSGYVCHTWITDGEAIYLPDTTHDLVGQTVPLLPCT